MGQLQAQQHQQINMITSTTHIYSTLDYNYIDDGIYIGTNQCCQTHFNEKLKNEEGIEVDISLEKESIDSPFGVDFYLWMPVKDHTPPSPEQFEIGVSSIEKFISLNKKIYIHCKNGHGRAPTMVAAYFIKNKKMNPTEAIEFIRSKRPTMHMQDAQRDALEAYRASL